MKTIFLVSPEDADLARTMERRLLELPAESGIMFVGAEVMPATDERLKPMFRVVVGYSRDYNPKLMTPLVRQTLRDLIEPTQLIIEAHRGIDRSTLAH